MRSAEDRCHTVFLAAVCRLSSTLMQDENSALHNAGLLSQTKDALIGLHAVGIVLDKRAMPHRKEEPPAEAFDLECHLGQPLPKRQRAWWALVDARMAERLRALGANTSRRIHSCGGPEGGA